MAAQLINHDLWYTSNIKPHALLLGNYAITVNHSHQTNHSSFCVLYCNYIKQSVAWILNTSSHDKKKQLLNQ
jgi:Tfp pilus assembly ATPase PilU